MTKILRKKKLFQGPRLKLCIILSAVTQYNTLVSVLRLIVDEFKLTTAVRVPGAIFFSREVFLACKVFLTPAKNNVVKREREGLCG